MTAFGNGHWIVAGTYGRSMWRREIDENDPGTDVAVVGDRSGADLRLLPAAPNPFREQTAVRFELAAGAEVTVELFDVAGRRVRELPPTRFGAGPHRVAWDGRDDAGGSLPPGVYFARLTADGRIRTQKLTKAGAR